MYYKGKKQPSGNTFVCILKRRQLAAVCWRYSFKSMCSLDHTEKGHNSCEYKKTQSGIRHRKINYACRISVVQDLNRIFNYEGSKHASSKPRFIIPSMNHHTQGEKQTTKQNGSCLSTEVKKLGWGVFFHSPNCSPNVFSCCWYY